MTGQLEEEKVQSVCVAGDSTFCTKERRAEWREDAVRLNVPHSAVYNSAYVRWVILA